jgi:hypothetical protein
MRKLACLLWLVGIGTGFSHAAAIENVTVDAATNVYGKADTRYAGFLHAMNTTGWIPGPDVFEKLKPSILRVSEGSGDFFHYQRITKAGGMFQYVLSDALLGLPNPPTPGDNDDPTYGKWDALVNAKIAAAKAAGATTAQCHWDTWNEPDYSWPDQSDAGVQHFFQTWKRTYDMVRAELPNVKIVGPSLALHGDDPAAGVINYNNFLDFCNNNACMPDVVTIHAFTKGQAGLYAQWLNDKFTSLHLTEPPAIAANEMIGRDDQFRPGAIPHYFANLRQADLQYGIHSCWCEPDGRANTTMLDGLLNLDTGLPRSTWWVYEKYAQMSGQYVSLTGSSSVTGLASVDAVNHKLMVLLGRDATGAGAIDLQLQIKKLTTALGFTGALRADLWRIENSDINALASPTPSSLTLLTSESVCLTLPDFGANDAYYVTLAPVER